MSDIHKPTSLGAIQVQNLQMTIITEEKVEATSWLEQVRIVDNVRFTHISVRTVRNNAARITESANSRTTKAFV
jgi:hypothetical protein